MANYISKFTGAEIDKILQDAKTVGDKFELVEKDIAKNATDIKVLYAGLKQKNIIIPATVENTAISRQTADGLTVVDGSTATVKKIQGATVDVDGVFKHAQISGIKSIGNLFVSPNLRTAKTYDPTNISENDIYYGLTYTGAQYNAITDITTTEGGITFKQNMAQAIAIGFPVRVAGLSAVAVKMFVSFPDTTETASFYSGYICLDKNGNTIDKNVGYATPNAETGRMRIIRTIPEGTEWLIFIWGERYNTVPNRLASFSKIMMVAGDTDADYEPYTESIMTLPETVELAEWDYIENGKKVIQTIVEDFDSTKYDEENGTYNGTTDFILTGDRAQVAYKGTPTSTDFAFNNDYIVHDKGKEQMQLGNSESVPTVTTEYLILGGAE